jgi:sugar phosphate permease
VTATPNVADQSNPNVQVPRYSFYALGVLTGVNLLNYIDRQVFPAVAFALKQDPRLHLSDTEIGAIEPRCCYRSRFSRHSSTSRDRYSRTKLMAGAAVVWSIATGLTALTDLSPILPPALNFTVPITHFGVQLSGIAIALCLVRALVGVGESSYSTITPTLIADYFPPLRRATALGIFQAAIPMGFALGYVIGGILAHFFGWRVAFMVVGLPGMIAALVVWRLNEPVWGRIVVTTVHSEESVPAHPTSAGRESWLSIYWRILNTRDWLLSTLGLDIADIRAGVRLPPGPA